MKSKRAWIVRWDVSADRRDGVVPGSVLTFIDARLAVATVVKILKALWVSHSRLMWRERLAFAVDSKSEASTFVVQNGGVIYVGSKPRLTAKIVYDIDATDADDGGCVGWSDRDGKKRFQQNKLPLPE